MKMPSFFASTAALLVWVGGLAISVSAQTETNPAAERAAQPAKPAPAPETPPPSVKKPDHGTDAGGETPATSRRVDDFAETDTDRDGRVSAKEYAASPLAALAMIADGKRNGSETTHGGFSLIRNEDRPGQSGYFRRLDTNGDGYLTREELNGASRQGAASAKK